MNPRNELLGDGDMKSLVQQIITDEMEDLEEGVMDFAKKVGNYVMHGGKDPFNDYLAFAKRRIQVSDPRLLAMMQRQFPKAAPADLARAIAQARKAAA
jgi:acetone carboxylase gamma subunit